MTSALIGASSPEQVTDSVKALDNLSFNAEELKEIDRHAVEGGVNLWRQSAELGGLGAHDIASAPYHRDRVVIARSEQATKQSRGRRPPSFSWIASLRSQ